MSLARILKSYGNFSYIQDQEMVAILDFMGMCLSDHSKASPNRFHVPINLGVEPNIMSPAQIFTEL